MMSTSPAIDAHRILIQPNFSGKLIGAPRDAVVKSKSVNPTTGDTEYEIRGQPYKDHIRGISFFSPAVEHTQLIHKYLDRQVDGCMIIPKNTPLPPNFLMKNDKPLKLALRGPVDPTIVECGEHIVLYPASDTTSTAFVAAYTDLKQYAVPCNIAGGAEPQDISFDENLDVDTYVMPGDLHSEVCVLAMRALAKSSPDANVRFFALMFSFHIAADDTSFANILKDGQMASMAAAAMDVWTERDPFRMEFTHAVQKQLADLLERPYVPAPYKPYLVSWTPNIVTA